MPTTPTSNTVVRFVRQQTIMGGPWCEDLRQGSDESDKPNPGPPFLLLWAVSMPNRGSREQPVAGLSWTCSSPAPASVRECADLLVPEQPRYLGDRKCRVLQVPYGERLAQLVFYSGKGDAFFAQTSRQGSFAEAELSRNRFNTRAAMRKQRRKCILHRNPTRAFTSAPPGDLLGTSFRED